MPRHPSRRALSNRVTLRRLLPGQDADAGLAGAWPPVAAGVACSVQLDSSEVEVINDRISRRNRYTITFAADYGLMPRDEVVWTDQGTPRTLLIAGRVDAAGRGRAFAYTADEVV